MKKVYGYLRVSTDTQDLRNQRLAIHEYCHKHSLKVHQFIEVQMSSRKDAKERRIDELLSKLQSADMLIVSELSRLGRSVGQVVTLIDELIKKHVRVV